MRVLLVSTYDLGHQPFGLASPAAVLRAHGHEVVCVDLSLDPLPDALLRSAPVAGFFLPMHTAARLALPLIARARRLNPSTRLFCFGLYAHLNRAHLADSGVQACFGGEFEDALLQFVEQPSAPPPAPVSLARLAFLPPDRSVLPPLARYPRLRSDGEALIAGYTEASRGCKHLCRHCPVVPVYQGAFRVVPRDVVLEDIRRQVAAGARHISFGDPDFFNGPLHARRLAEALHAEFPSLTYDATIKIEHLRRHRDLLPVLKDTGCLFVTSAVESADDRVLEKLDKGHTRADFAAVARDFQRLGLALAPTFIPFTPWTTADSYRELLDVLLELDLVDNTAPIQLALRLLIPDGSLLLQLDDVRARITGFDPPALLHRWTHPDPAVDALAAAAFRAVSRPEIRSAPRRAAFAALWNLVHSEPPPEDFGLLPRATVPFLEEPWYC